MKFIEELNIKLSQLVKLDFIPKNIEVTSLYLTDFTLFNYDSIDLSYYPRRQIPGGNKQPVINDLSLVKNFIDNTNLDDFINVEKFDRYYREIVSTYISVLLEEVKTGSFKNIESFINDPLNLELIFKSPQYSYTFLESKNILKDDYYNKYKDTAENSLLDGNLFWAYKYSYHVLDGPFEKLEDDPRFIKYNNKSVRRYFNKIVFRRGFFNPEKDVLKLFYRYWNHPDLKIPFKQILSTIDIIECFYFLRDYHIPELEKFFIETRVHAFVDYCVDITFYDNHMKLEDKYIGEKTEDLDDKITRLSKVIIDNPELLETFIAKMKNREDLFKKITKITLNQYILDNASYIKKSLLKNHEIMIRFIEFNYLNKHSLVKQEFPEAIKAILKSKNSENCFFYLKDIILKHEPNTDPKEIAPFLDVISTSSTYSLMYALITKKRFPQGEKEIFSDPENKKEYLEFLKELDPEKFEDYDFN